MRFMLLLKSNKDLEAGTAAPDEAVIRAMDEYNQKLIKEGLMLMGEGLHPSKNGFQMTNQGGKISVKDGPFAEAKELVAGFWMIQSKSLAEAVEWAKRVPFGNTDGQIEVRPIVEVGDYGPGDGGVPPTLPPPPAGPPMQKWMMSFYADAKSESGAPPSQEQIEKMGALVGEMVMAGRVVAGEGLQPSSKSARVYFTKGKPRVVDGPFAETKELIAGFVILRCKSREEAIEFARRGCLANGDSRSEARPVFSEADFPAELVEKTKDVFEGERKFREERGQQ